jgi:hypothetical protein
LKVSTKTLVQLTPIVIAAIVAVFPPAPATVERSYARWLYPALQENLTAFSNRSVWPLFDFALVTVVALLIGGWIYWLRRIRRERWFRPIGRGLLATLAGASIVYLWFLAAWGLNYARPPLESVLAFDESRISPIAVRLLAEHAVREANRTYAAAHAAGFPGIHDRPAALAAALHQVERELGRPRPTQLTQPKTSIVSPFYRATGISGQLAPFFLETLLNPDLTGPERPSVLAHEWAHLSGFAPESDASFVGYLAALRAGPAAEYSAWLDLVSEAANQLQPVTQRLVLEPLADGPRRDQQAIRERLKALVQPVERVTWSAYDQMLKSQGIEEGVRSYSRVIQLLIGTDALGISSPKPQVPSPASQAPSP